MRWGGVEERGGGLRLNEHVQCKTSLPTCTATNCLCRSYIVPQSLVAVKIHVNFHLAESLGMARPIFQANDCSKVSCQFFTQTAAAPAAVLRVKDNQESTINQPMKSAISAVVIILLPELYQSSREVSLMHRHHAVGFQWRLVHLVLYCLTILPIIAVNSPITSSITHDSDIIINDIVRWVGRHLMPTMGPLRQTAQRAWCREPSAAASRCITGIQTRDWGSNFIHCKNWLMSTCGWPPALQHTHTHMGQ